MMRGKLESFQGNDVENLSRVQRLFVAEYCTNGMNATQAYLLTHPKATAATARAQGSKYIAEHTIRREISRFVDDAIEGRRKALAYRIMQVLERRAFFKIHDFMDLKSGKILVSAEELEKRGLAEIIDGITEKNAKDGTIYVEYSFASRAQAIDSLAKILGLFNRDELVENESTKVIVLPGTMSIDEWNETYGPKEAKIL